MWTHGAGSTGAATFPTSAPIPLCWEVIQLIKGFSHGPEFLEGLFSSHKSLYNALSHVISPVLCHLSMQCFRVLRNQRADVGADPQPAQHQLGFGVELWPLTPAVLVLSKWNRKRSQLPNATVSVETALRFLKQDRKSQHPSPWLLSLLQTPKENESCKVFFRFTWEKKQEQCLVTSLYYFSSDAARIHWKMSVWTLSWEGLIMNKVTCESEFQGASLLADKPEYFKWKHTCL